jgi:hypothetical protein
VVIIFFYYITYYIILYYTILYYITLYYIILYYIILYYTLLFHATNPPSVLLLHSYSRYSQPYSPHSHIGVNNPRNVHTNVKLKRVLVNTVTVRKQYFLHILSVCLQP